MNRSRSIPALDPRDYRIGVVLPVYSETDSVRRVAAAIRGHAGPRLSDILIVLSPRSSPESRSVCEDLARSDARIRIHVQQRNPGLGHAVREGLERVRGNVILMMDSDGEMDSDTIPRMLARMESTNAAMVLGSRWAPGGGFSGYDRKKLPLNWCFQQIFRLLFATRMHDLTYGYKLLRAEVARSLPWCGTLHEIACETSLRPIRAGYSVCEVPTVWTARTVGVSKNSFLRNFRYVRMALGILLGRNPRGTAGTAQGEPVATDLSY